MELILWAWGHLVNAHHQKAAQRTDHSEQGSRQLGISTCDYSAFVLIITTLFAHRSSHSLLVGRQQLLDRWPIDAAVPPSTDSLAAEDDVSITGREESLDQRDVVDVREREVLSSHVLPLLQEPLRHVEEGLDRLQRTRDHGLIRRQAHELLGELLERDLAGGIGEVEHLGGLGLVEQRRGLDVGVRGQQRERVLLRQVLADRSALVQSEALGEGDDGNLAPWVTLHVFCGLCGASGVLAMSP